MSNPNIRLVVNADGFRAARAIERAMDARRIRHEQVRAIRLRFDLLRDRVRDDFARRQAELVAAQPRRLSWPRWLAPWRWSTEGLQVATMALTTLILLGLIALLILSPEGGF
jgi:hypothetical protein